MPEAKKDAEARMAERFQRDTANHEMAILHDDGLYRHLRFRRPDSSTYWFNLITWPGNLTITGDMGTFVFSRVEDMFWFFRGSSAYMGINPEYWAQKARSISTEGLKIYSEEIFRQAVADLTNEYRFDYPGLEKAVNAQLLGNTGWDAPDLHSEESARAALDAFRFEYMDAAGKEEFRFTDTWEFDFRDWTAQYLWCCHAIVWGIAQYDARPTVVEDEPDPSDPRQIAVGLMLDAAHDLEREAVWAAIDEHCPGITSIDRASLIETLHELAETANITIEWSEATA